MGRALEVQAEVWKARSVNESTFLLRGPNLAGSGDMAGTVSTKNIEDLFRAKNYVEGREFWWEGPWKLHLQDQAIDRDVLDHLEIQGAEQQ